MNSASSPPAPTPSVISTWIYRSYVALARHHYAGRRGAYIRRIYRRLFAMFDRPILIDIHGYPAIANLGYTYPVLLKLQPDFNNPLIELAYQASKARGRPITFIDIGAAIGDTALMIKAFCPGMIERFYCIDGDREFLSYLTRNVGHMPEGRILTAMLSDTESQEKELVRTHSGTASAQGENYVASTTLDRLLAAENPARIDMLKIDVDGFDGRVLLGAQATLRKYQPDVIFEWHPMLCEKTGNSWTGAFEALEANGYEQFLWFVNTGQFSHATRGCSRADLAFLAELSRRNKHRPDWHFDVIALHKNSPVDPYAVAELTYSRLRKPQLS